MKRNKLYEALYSEVKIPTVLKYILLLLFSIIFTFTLIVVGIIALLYFIFTPHIRSQKVIGRAYSLNSRYVFEVRRVDWGGSWAPCTNKGCGGIHTERYLIDRWGLIGREKHIEGGWPAPCNFVEETCEEPLENFDLKDGNITWYGITKPIVEVSYK